MQCAEARRFIPAYLDKELDLTTCLEIEAHLANCAVCRQVHEGEKALKGAFRTNNLYFTAPPGLQSRIRQSLPSERGTPVMPRNARRWRSYGLAVAAALFLMFAIAAAYRSANFSQGDLMAQEVLSSHLRSLMVAHLYDVRSSDKHTVKPWFNGKIDYAPDVKELRPQGFPLVGGRLDYLANRPVAALVYQRQKHIINLYLWPAAKELDSEMKLVSLRGYNLWHWTNAGVVCWAVSDLNDGELREFALHIQDQSVPAK